MKAAPVVTLDTAWVEDRALLIVLCSDLSVGFWKFRSRTMIAADTVRSNSSLSTLK